MDDRHQSPQGSHHHLTTRSSVGYFLFLFFLALFGTRVFAGEPASGRLDVVVRGRPQGDSVPVRGVYLALVPMDQPASRPAVEGVGDGGIQWRDVPPGQYALIVEAPSFDPAFRRVDIGIGKAEEESIELEPQFELTGNIVDVSGHPVAGARVCHARVATAAVMNNMSELAQRIAVEHLCTKADDNGWWKLSAPTGRGSDLLIEAPGYEPAWVRREPKAGEAPAITLRKGTSLRAITNRPAPEMALALIPSAPIESSIPVWAQKSIWGREVATTSVEWISLPAGEYDIVATWPDPRRFSAPVTLRHVRLSSDRSDDIQLSLPDEPLLRSKTARIFTTPKIEIRDLRAFVRTPAGVKQIPASSELTPRGRVLYADADAGPEDVFFTTAGEVILPVSQAHAVTRQEAAIEGIKLPKAAGKLRVGLPEGGTLPSHGNATFHACSRNAQFVLPVNVAKNGDVSLPLLVGCGALTLRFDTFSPLALVSQPHPGEEVWLGAHTLKAPASAEIHIVQEPNETNVPEAIVTASVARGPGEFLQVARGVAGADGRLIMDGLPAGEEITFRAEEPSTKLTGTIKRAIEPGQRAVVDPLSLPQPVELTVSPRFDDDFKNDNPNIEIIGIVVESETAHNQSAKLSADQQEAVFRGLSPGTWSIRAMVRMAESNDTLSTLTPGDTGGITQPVDAGTVVLELGARKKIEPVIRPLVLSGQVTLHGRGVKTSLAITDPPGPSAIIRRVFSKEDGTFHAFLPRPGLYTFSARRRLNDPDVELAPIRFDESSRDVQIALPEGSISVRVVSGASGDVVPAADAQLTAVMPIDIPQNGFSRLERKDRTDAKGEAMLDELQEGTWLVTARAKDGGVAEKTVTVSKDHAASVTLTLDNSALEGVVLDGAGTPAAMAAVDCIYSGSGNIPRTVRAETDSRGQFSIPIAKPAPERVMCGVTAMDGAIGSFIAALGSDARFALPSATSVLTITHWSDRGNRDRFWLVAPDGGLFDLSWAANKLRRLDAPLIIPKLPAGAWSVVRVDSIGAFQTLARGGGGALPPIVRVRVSAGQRQEISMQTATAPLHR